MNKRIEELLERAGFCGTGFHNTLIGVSQETALKNFAEMIIKECAGLVQGVPIDTMGYQTADQKIKQHFGVEE